DRYRCRAGAAQFAVSLGGDDQHPQTRSNLVASGAAPGARGVRSGLRTQQGPRRCDAVGGFMIPVLLLTGFLGSGKTTLLGHLLRQQDFARTAVIINEFGEIGLDHELVEKSDDSVVALSTGCLCCKVRGDLVETLADLLCRRDAGAVPPFTRVVIETSGLADPAPILQTLMTDATIGGRLVLDGVVTTVDAVNGAATLAREAISVKQVAVADRLVVTKSDLADAEQSALLGRLAALNAGAPLLQAQHGAIDPQLLFDAGPYDP